MRLGNEDRVSCASSLLKKDARIWWDIVKKTRDVQVFNKKYYSHAILARRVDEFITHTQENLIVTEYARKFDRLAKFAADIETLDIALEAEQADNKGKTTSKDNRNKKLYVEYPQCLICKKKHSGECIYKTKGCFNCGQEGHLKKDCPKLRDQKKDDKLVPARVFALTKGEAETSNTVVSSQITISGKPFNVLFDSGAMHSFISINRTNNLDKQFIP
ncbi:uncharacterized protein LOC133815393 [Humulus lupulus]|uniref:uncharacterized protein LOC133815393 n=1 Tax=Humulus lupulus TaxID=3486 RepID=UPI002B40E8BA|nr:uncharacterized protein LOC133815393 [Humulus lupulus]